MTKQTQFLITNFNTATYARNPQQTKDEWELGSSRELGDSSRRGAVGPWASLAVAAQLGILVRDGLRRSQVGVSDHELF